VRNGKIRVGVVGVGGISRDQHLPGWAQVPFAEVAALSDVSQEALARAGQLAGVPAARQFRDWQDLVALDELDVVDICTPNQTHAPIALAALRAGKHVLCEKPLATTAADVRLLIDAADAGGRVLMAAQHFRFQTSSRQLKDQIDEGLLGHVYYARAQWLRRRGVPGRPTFIDSRLSGGGPALDIGVHVLDLAVWLLDLPEPVGVSAMTCAHLAQRPDVGSNWGDWDRQRFDVEEFAAFVRFANGAVLSLETSWLAFQPEHDVMRLQCYGTRGGAIWPDGILTGETDREPWDRRLEELPKIKAFHAEILQFALAVRDGLPSPVPPEQSLRLAAILEGLYRSARERRETNLTAPVY
jgi:predicted dehydrogenase